MRFSLLRFAFAENQTILLFTEMAPGANVPLPTASCDQLNSTGQDDNDESMALLDEEHRESGNESDVAPSLNEEEEEPGDGLTGKTSVDLLIFSCK